MSVGKRTWETPSGESRTVPVVRWYDAEGKYRQRTFQRVREAKDYDAQVKGDLKKGIHRPDRNSATIRQVAALWLERAEAEKLEPEVIERNKNHCRLHIEVATVSKDTVNGWDGEFGDFKLSRLTTPVCEAFRLYLLTDKKWIRGRKTDKTISHRTDKTISRRTAQDILTSFKGMLNEAQRQGLIDYNPALPVHISTKTREQARIRIGEQIPDRPEVRDALDALTGRWHKIFMTDAFTGMRSSELRGLAWPGVKLETLKIEVYQRANMSGKIGPCKSKAGYREISIPLILADELRRWKLICPPSPENLVFPDDDGNVISRFIIRYEWQAVQRRIKMIRSDKKAKYNVHALRHFFASIMIAEGTPPKRLQELLGHATLAMTMDLYGHLFPAGEAEAARANSAAARVLAD